LQPTVVDINSFFVWKDEAFSLWNSHWASNFLEESPSFKILNHISSTFYLVSIVENDYVNGDLFDVCNKFIFSTKRTKGKKNKKNKKRKNRN